ncbi:DUF58 domain-containing protein, partial [Bacillus cereus]|nr:DUF58 domain-containing protein [Bacillus cereus]
MNGQRVVTVPLFFQLHIIQLTVPGAILFTFFMPQRIIMFSVLCCVVFTSTNP